MRALYLAEGFKFMFKFEFKQPSAPISYFKKFPPCLSSLPNSGSNS